MVAHKSFVFDFGFIVDTPYPRVQNALGWPYMWTLLMRHHTFYVFAKLLIGDNQASDATQHSPLVSQSYL